jgi:hypothetical protein
MQKHCKTDTLKLNDSANLPDPDIIAAEIVEDLPWRAVAQAKEASRPRPVR